MSFSGLFPKNSNKRKAEDEGLDENKTETEFSSKKQKFCDDYESEEDMFADENEEIDENVQEDALLPLASVCIDSFTDFLKKLGFYEFWNICIFNTY